MNIEIDAQTLPPIKLRYYKGWTIEFNIKTESFQCPLLNLFNFSCVRDLENAADIQIQNRNK